jgi:hypothetical protein
MTKYSIYVWWGALILIVLIFSSLRLPSIYYREVAYTYDQARDFLAGARMVTDHHLTFIGPTTGIGGLFHGVWWYYFTAFTFLISHNPITVYVAVFLVQLISLIVGMIVIRRLLGSPVSLIFGMIVSTGSYFIRTSTFVGNNIMAIPSYLTYILSLSYLILNQPKGRNRLVALAIFGLSAGFVAEFELAFGLFLLPVTFLVCFLTPLRRLLNTKRSFFVYIWSVIFPFIPRILFEIKNHFIQTKVLLGFFTKPKYYTPKPYADVLSERVANFHNYFNEAYLNAPILYVFIALILIAVILYFAHTSLRRNIGSRYTLLFVLVIAHAGLFLFSLGYKDTFWNYYYEGIQYGLLITGLLALSIILSLVPSRYTSSAMAMLTVVFIITSVIRIIPSWNTRNELNGLAIQEKVMQYIVDQEKPGRPFCAKVYVAPVIPYTYDYLWLYHYLNKTIETPRDSFQRGYCWYILEPDQKGFEFRTVKWKEDNIPAKATTKPEEKKMINHIEISKYYLDL